MYVASGIQHVCSLRHAAAWGVWAVTGQQVLTYRNQASNRVFERFHSVTSAAVRRGKHQLKGQAPQHTNPGSDAV